MEGIELIEIGKFRILSSVNGTEFVAVSRNGGTFRVNSGFLVGEIARREGFIKSNALLPLERSKLDKTSVVNNLTTPSSTSPVSALQAMLLKDMIANFSGQIGSGIIGEAFPATIPISEGFGIYTVSTAGTFVNFKDVNDVPLIVSQDDLDSGLVQLWGNDNVWEKQITPVDLYTPVFSNNLFSI